MPAEPPEDKFKLVYLVMIMQGIGTLLPWNMFINAFDYFTKYKFSEEYLGYQFEYMDIFMQSITFCSNLPQLIMAWVNVFVQIKGGMELKIIICSYGIIIVFLVTIFFAVVNTGGMAMAFFCITLISIIIINSFNGIYQPCVYGIAARLPPAYSGVIVFGNNICGTFTSIVDILSKLGTKNLKTSAIYYFITAVVVLSICVDLIIALPLNRYWAYATERQKRHAGAPQPNKEEEQERPPYLTLLKQTYMQLLCCFLTLASTIAVFPAICSNVPSVHGSIPQLFTSLTCFLNFNVSAMIGSYITKYYQWPSVDYLWIVQVARFGFVPYFLLCNYQLPHRERHIPVLLKSDIVFVVGGALNGLTTGYFTGISMMYATSKVEDPKWCPLVGTVAAACLITGIMFGIIISYLWPVII